MESHSLPGAWAKMVLWHQPTGILGQVERQIKESLSLFVGTGAGVPEDGVIRPGCAWCRQVHSPTWRTSTCRTPFENLPL